MYAVYSKILVHFIDPYQSQFYSNKIASFVFLSFDFLVLHGVSIVLLGHFSPPPGKKLVAPLYGGAESAPPPYVVKTTRPTTS